MRNNEIDGESSLVNRKSVSLCFDAKKLGNELEVRKYSQRLTSTAKSENTHPHNNAGISQTAMILEFSQTNVDASVY